MNRRVVFLALFALVASAAPADRLILKSGSFLTGTAGEAKNGKLKFKSDDLGEIEVKLENIAKLENAGTHVIRYVDGREESKKLSVAAGAYVADAAPLDMTRVKEIDPVVERWHGSIHAAYNATRGNTFENKGSVLANLNRRWESDRLQLDFGYHYGESGSSGQERQKTTDRWEAEAKHDHFWWTKVYHFEDLRYDRDMIQLLRARYRVGLGGGYQWLEKTEFRSTGLWSFNQEAGVNWIKEDFENNDKARKNGYCALRYAHHLNWLPKWTTGLEVFHNLELLPQADEWDKLLARSDFGFTAKLLWDFDLIGKIEWDYDSKPASGRRKSDTRYLVGLGYKW